MATVEEHAVRSATPWWHWLVAVLSLLWNAGGAIDYVMTQTRNEAYLSGFSEEALAYYYEFPAWADAFWALGVWGAALGSLLLLLRSKFAPLAFMISIVGLIGTTFYQLTADMPADLAGPGQWAFAAAIWIITLGLFFYSRQMVVRGVLR